ncbi:MAG: hypothetical protein JW854_12265 [Actinobacteria bacterium]|nr:hypothetical protein [Actinomycetota bacterium]
MERMTSLQRIETAIGLGKPDRVPVVPIIDMFSSRYGGISQYDMLFDLKKADRALEKTLQDLGSIDAQNMTYMGMGRTLSLFFPKPIMPGIGGVPRDAQLQFVEVSIMEPQEYAEINEKNALRWILKKMRMTHPQLNDPLSAARSLAGVQADFVKMRISARKWRRKGVEHLLSYNFGFVPFEYLSMMVRSINNMTLDLFRYPDEVKSACKALMGPLKMMGMASVLSTGIKRIFLGGVRTSASFIGPRQFEEFALEQWIEMVEYYVGKGITPILHYDCDWTPFFPYLRHFPRGKCVLNLDGTSDIFKAKEILGDHMCIMGDVPADLLKLGEPDEVDEYCRRLIVELGADGGFILSGGCTVPVDSKPENVEAMLQSVHRYRP